MSAGRDWKAKVVSSIWAHRLAKPMKVVKDAHGCTWLCDMHVDETKDLASQGCWRCGSSNTWAIDAKVGRRESTEERRRNETSSESE